jgi:pimeloyl-ACP methyl ester carboxylesterase
LSRPLCLGDEVELIEPVLARAGSPLVLVGHSYGAAVALIAALRQPARVKALVLYEPTLFSLIEAESPQPNQADGIRQAVAAAAEALDRGDENGAAEQFIDYWMGVGSWASMPESRKSPIAASVKNVRRWAQALFTEPAPLAAFRALDMPVLYMVGGRSTASAHGVSRLLAPALPRVTQQRFDSLGHMGPVTDPEPVNRAIEDFLARL